MNYIIVHNVIFGQEEFVRLELGVCKIEGKNIDEYLDWVLDGLEGLW